MVNGEFVRQEVADGLALNTSVVRLPLRYPSYTYSAMRGIRRVPGMRTRILVAPESAQVVIPVKRTALIQLRAKQDSWLWGLRLAVIAPSTASDVAIRITETGGYPLFSNWVRGTQFTPNTATGQPQPMYFLPFPWQIPSGLLTVEVTNRSATNPLQCQLALWVQEESDLINQKGGLFDIQANPSGTYAIHGSIGPSGYNSDSGPR